MPHTRIHRKSRTPEIQSGRNCHFLISPKFDHKFDYSSEVVCEEPGQFALRGGLIDIYPVNSDFPVRIDFFGDTVEEIRSFDPTTQRTISVLPEISISSIGDQTSSREKWRVLEIPARSSILAYRGTRELTTVPSFGFSSDGQQGFRKKQIFHLFGKEIQMHWIHFLVTSEMNTGSRNL